MDDPERIAREAAECAVRNNHTVPPTGIYCEGTFDTWLCWPPTPANSSARALCPAFGPGFSTDLFAHKDCMADGTWFRHPVSGKPWSNYTGCVDPEDDVSGVIAVYEAGYSVSLLALLLSLAILGHFKSLRCARITVHMNLFASFALNNVLWLAWYALVVRSPDTLVASPAWCRALRAALDYALLTTYTWALCEGVYLHTVLVSAFVSERRLLRSLLAAGWLVPVPSMIYYLISRIMADDQLCWMEEATPRAELAAVVVTAVLLNLCFLCNIVRVLCSKLRAAPRPAIHPSRPRPTDTALHALRATCLLVPLLGLQYLLTPFRPSRGAPGWRVYEYVAALAAALQGLAVALLYCFFNAEVLAQLRRRLRTLAFRVRANSTTNTTVSFVRSTAPEGGEDKV